jgi:hypothetical protein
MRTLLSKLCGKFNMLYFWCIVTAHYPFLIILLFSQAFFSLKINVEQNVYIGFCGSKFILLFILRKHT